MFAGTFSKFLFCLRLKHPFNDNKLLIDYDFSLLVISATLFGAKIGFILNSILAS